MGTLVLDSSVVIAIASERDALRADALELVARWRRARVLLPAVAYSEVMVEPIRMGRAEDRERRIRKAGFEIVPIDAEIAREAARARAQHPGLRLPDAVVIATALVHDADLATLDRRMASLHADLRG